MCAPPALNSSFIHLGIHNLPASSAPALLEEMRGYTSHPQPGALTGILVALHEMPGVLVVFNHPLWDEPGIGNNLHRAMLDEFLKTNGTHIHAFELNGLRPWTENSQVNALAAGLNKPAISGGDRHAMEPNACLNLTNANTFSEFVTEIRDGYSNVLFMPQYRQAPGARIMHMVIDIMSNHPGRQ